MKKTPSYVIDLEKIKILIYENNKGLKIERIEYLMESKQCYLIDLYFTEVTKFLNFEFDILKIREIDFESKTVRIWVERKQLDKKVFLQKITVKDNVISIK